MPGFFLRDALVAIGLLKADNEPTPLTSLFSNLPSYHRILIAGLHNTVKSTLLQKHLASNVKHVTTFTMFTVCHVDIYRCGNVTFHVMDIGASRPSGFHTMERAFFNQADAVIWVIDANDCDTHVESREELINKVDHKDGMPKDTPLLILANKRDPNDIEAVQKTESFFFDQASSALAARPHAVFGTNIHTGEGLPESFKWLSEMVANRTTHDTRGTESAKVSCQDEVVAILENGTGRKFERENSQ
ncbi:hypothetical protein NXS19_006795 [Fusarium pseudograminearum]|uniref:ADP-ribosylation factor n=1 Tax=Fusarium pseudograminearum (strain CS3096) TaxID=1028729 RepID=K3VIK3_FUSPC|nr:hypothetical protein FPSE_05493 [Fusarium pseudograminearum CS3096]EKJ74347.1 hypothetical protein FPSE_05493 [Fusarium pseudograminearum CS3096]UZP38979.1 hypothetical protein NXS19_006795 [Fusarium pseudograminearum]